MRERAAFRLEECPCPLCGAPAPQKSREAFPPYRVVDCPGCALRYLSPRVAEEEMPALYRESDYWEGGGAGGGYASYEAMEPLLVRTFLRRLSLLPSPAKSSRLLDVGCGPGAGIVAAERAGFSPFGLDLSPVAVESAQRRFGDRVRLGRLSERLFPEGSFDVVTLFDVFEHVYAPRPFVEDLAWHLAPGGTLLLATPNCESLLARTTGRRWVSYKIPEHVAFYSPATMAAVLEPRFTIERLRACGQDVSLDFLATRLADALPAASGPLRALSRVPALARARLYVNSGSMLVVASRRRSP
jgi:2-polyprenyl-3-methyl-5-hydroxy-6-metoxy-1,4-benzoquinol methylase